MTNDEPTNNHDWIGVPLRVEVGGKNVDLTELLAILEQSGVIRTPWRPSTFERLLLARLDRLIELLEQQGSYGADVAQAIRDIRLNTNRPRMQ